MARSRGLSKIMADLTRIKIAWILEGTNETNAESDDKEMRVSLAARTHCRVDAPA